jgi:bifunctional polynucleotide phosphatase/kinase
LDLERKQASHSQGTDKAEPIHSFFTGGVKALGDYQRSPETLIHYLHNDPFLPSPSLPATTDPAGPSVPRKIRVIFYDLDGTLIKPKSGSSWPNGRDDWAWWHPSVPARLKREVQEGWHLIVISNQGSSNVKLRAEWRAKIPLIAAKVSGQADQLGGWC